MMFEENELSYQPAAMKKRKTKNKRRFSDEQIRSLEVMFESETKLEPRKKMQVARELGLHPRQVAIWFQNKRARWKSKQLESDYGVLQANYNALASDFEALNKEKQALLIQLQKLNDLMQKSGEERKDFGQDTAEDSIGDQLGRGEDTKSEFKAKPNLLLERAEEGIHVFSDDASSIRAGYFGLDEEPDYVNMVEPADSSENWGSLDSEGGLLDESGSSYQWWDFWT